MPPSRSLFAALAIAASSLACSGPRHQDDRGGEPAAGRAASTAAGEVGPQSWVEVYDPEAAASGYTLALFWSRRPTLFDMNGAVVHEWPTARVKSRVRLLPNGNLLGLALGRAVVEYDWDGNLVWSYETGADLPHHDVIRLANGHTLFPLLPDGERLDHLVEVDTSGNVVWRWRAEDHLSSFIASAHRHHDNLSHINSVDELPENPLYAAGDERFRPGNILISARNLNRIFLVDKASGAVVWSWGDELDLQHEARMIPPEFRRHGGILLFDNGYGSRYRYRRSRILEIDPADDSVVWRYEEDEFFSPTAGVEQPLANGNVFVVSSRGGRAFEIDRRGRIVWEWVPPFNPVRPSRYAYDHCPQLAARSRPRERQVEPPPGYRHVDRRLYQFAPRGGLREAELEGTVRRVLADNRDCRDLLLPTTPSLYVTYGIDRGHLQAAGRDDYSARFELGLETLDGESRTRLFADTVSLDSAERWRERTVDLARWSRRWVRICVATEELEASPTAATEAFAFWSNPLILPASSTTAAAADEDDPSPDDLTAAELEARRRHLQALGYVE